MSQRCQYPSDISRQQFAEIKPLLESARNKTRPRKLDLYEVFCAVLYVLHRGCSWRMLPAGFPKWYTVYAYWQIWNAAGNTDSLLQQALKKIDWRGPCQPAGRNAQPNRLIADAQSAQHAGSASPQGRVAGKKSLSS
ncbi:MAG: transposase [Verrucomicrobiales bacterium]|jgi:transposase|nr:transposase [Verrucomicrobiales bacterium]